MGARGFRTPVAALVLSGVFIAIFAYAAMLMDRFSPVYTPVECVNTNKTFEFHVNASGAHVTAFTVMECTNPNPFTVEISEGSPGRVFFHPEILDIGSVVVGAYSLPVGGVAEMRANVSLHIPSDDLPLLLEGEKAILEEMRVDAVAHLPLLGFSVAYRFNQVNTCGFVMKVFPATMGYKTGPAICATTEHELLRVVPHINATAAPFQIGVGSEHLAKAEQLRDAGCGTAMGVSGLLAVLFLRYALLTMMCADGKAKAMQFIRSTSGLMMGTAAKSPQEKASPEEPDKSPGPALRFERV